MPADPSPFETSGVVELAEHLSAAPTPLLADSPEARVLHEQWQRLNKASYAYTQSTIASSRLSDNVSDLMAAARSIRRPDLSQEQREMLTDRVVELGTKGSIRGLGLMHQSSLYAESCYAQLWRIVERSSRGRKPWLEVLPELRGFEPKGVRNARNNNFEHLDSERHGSMSGIRRTEGAVTSVLAGPDDDGLRNNVVEFVDDLAPRLEAALERFAAPQRDGG